MHHVYSETLQRVLAARQNSTPLPAEVFDTTPLLRQHFTVSSEVPHLQSSAWHDYLGRILDVSIPRSYQANGFRGEIDTYVMKQLAFLDSRTDPFSQTRSATRISRDNMRDYCFHVAIDGIIETVTGSLKERKSEQFVPGILALDLNQKMRMVRPTRARVLAFFLPRAVVEANIRDAESLHGRVITYTSPLTRMIFDHLSALCRELPALPDHAAEPAIRACAQLIMAAFGKQQRLDLSTSAAARSVLQHQVRRYVQTHLRSPELSPKQILQTFKMSRPTLYRIFEQEGGLATYIRNCRLRAAATEMIELPSLNILSIADDFGFGSASDFTRAFRRAYGISPQDFRALGIETMQL
jgi:AraC-like DNA-binding protein